MVKEIRALCATIITVKNNFQAINLVKKARSKLDRKRFCLSPNRSVGYSQPMINSLVPDFFNEFFCDYYSSKYNFNEYDNFFD